MESIVSDGLIWRNSWISPFEGGMTILWKVAIANSMTAAEVCKYIFNVNILSSDASAMHGRSLLDTEWMQGTTNSHSALQGIVRQQGLNVFAKKWCALVAADRNLRFCKQCMEYDYQSVFCQIDGLLHCPVHGVLLQEHCSNCNASTPRYAITRKSFSNPFLCPECGERYGLQKAGNDFCERNNKFHKYSMVRDWVASVESVRLRWPRVREWQSTNPLTANAKEQRVAIFNVLLELQASKGNVEFFDKSNARIYSIQSAPAIVKMKHYDESIIQDCIIDRIAIYKSIRRFVRRRVVRGHCKCLRFAEEKLVVSATSEAIYSLEPICPVVFAYFLWRHHFESNLKLYHVNDEFPKDLILRQQMIDWPEYGESPLMGWGHFSLICFEAYNEIALAWSKEESMIKAPFDKSSDWAQLFMFFLEELSPRFSSWPRALTFLWEDSSCSKQATEIMLTTMGKSDLRAVFEKPCAFSVS